MSWYRISPSVEFGFADARLNHVSATSDRAIARARVASFAGGGRSNSRRTSSWMARRTR